MNRTIAINRRQELSQFISQFIKAPLATGSVIPSSVQLARAMTETLDETSGFVVEYGPGTGSFTKEIVRRLRSPELLTAVEINPLFRDLLARRYVGVGVFESVDGYAPELQGRVSHVISGLPFSNMSRFVCEQIIDNIFTMLEDGGEFRTFLYSHTYKLKKNRRLCCLLKSRFKVVKTQTILHNFPPAVIISCLK